MEFTTVSDPAFVKRGISFDVEVSVAPTKTGFNITYITRYKDENGYIDDFPPKIRMEHISKDANQSTLNVWNTLLTLVTNRTKAIHS